MVYPLTAQKSAADSQHLCLLEFWRRISFLSFRASDITSRNVQYCAFLAPGASATLSHFHCHTTFLHSYPTTSCQDTLITQGPPCLSRVISQAHTPNSMILPGKFLLPLEVAQTMSQVLGSRGISPAEDRGRMPPLKHGTCKKSRVWGMLSSKYTVLLKFPQHCGNKHSEICHFFTLRGVTKGSVSY